MNEPRVRADLRARGARADPDGRAGAVHRGGPPDRPSNWRIIARHVLPNVMAPILVQMTVSFSTAILTEAALSFLGLGTQPPTASWGSC